jgi:hypothetical protein
MGALDGTIKTPVGTVSKKSALILGSGVAVLGFIVWYRQKQLGGTGDTAETETAINPATGYPYGSAEDAAALAEQASYVSPTVPTGGGSSVPTSNVGYSSNGQWTQAVVEYMLNNGLVEDTAQLSAALGKYITGAYATDTEVSLIQQAIAVQGFPPIAGTTGYPPSINRTPPSTTPTTPTGDAAAPRLHHVNTTKSSAILQWSPAANAKTYIVYKTGGAVVKSGVVETSFTVLNLKPNTTYSFSVAGVNADGKRSGKTSNVVTVKTKK